MAKQAEIFDEVDRLRDEVRQLEEMGEKIADSLTDERAKNATLTDELNRARGSDSDVLKFVPDDPNKVMPYCVVIGFFAMVGSSAILDVRPADYEFDFVVIAIMRFAAQVWFCVWCAAIYKRDAVAGLIKRVSVWVIAWACSMGIIALVNRGVPKLEYELITIANPANWWTVPFMVRGNGEPGVWLLFFIAADITAEFAGSRWALQKLLSGAERLKEAIQ